MSFSFTTTLLTYAIIASIFVLSAHIPLRETTPYQLPPVRLNAQRKIGMVATAIITPLVLSTLPWQNLGLIAKPAILILSFFLLTTAAGRIVEQTQRARYATIVFAAIASISWLVFSSWIITNSIASLWTLAILILARKQKFRTVLCFVSTLLVYDVFAVFGTKIMEVIASSVQNTPALIQIPASFSPLLSVIGWGDVAAPGAIIIITIERIMDRKEIWLGYGSILVYLATLFAASLVCVWLDCDQPGLLYLVPAVVIYHTYAMRRFKTSYQEIFEITEKEIAWIQETPSKIISLFQRRSV